MLNYQQEEPGMFPVIDQTFNQVHPLVKWVLAFCLAVGGYFVGVEQGRVPVALCMAIGFVLGLLLVALLNHLIVLLTASAIVIGAAVACFWLLGHDADLKHGRAGGSTQAAPAVPQISHSVLDDVRKAVRP